MKSKLILKMLLSILFFLMCAAKSTTAASVESILNEINFLEQRSKTASASIVLDKLPDMLACIILRTEYHRTHFYIEIKLQTLISPDYHDEDKLVTNVYKSLTLDELLLKNRSKDPKERIIADNFNLKRIEYIDSKNAIRLFQYLKAKNIQYDYQTEVDHDKKGEIRVNFLAYTTNSSFEEMISLGELIANEFALSKLSDLQMRKYTNR